MTDINSYNLEDIVLGSVLTDNNCIDFVLTNLKMEDFFIAENKLIFNSLVRLYTDAKKIDLVTLVQDLKQNKDDVPIGYIMKLMNIISVTTNIESHVEYLKNESIKKHLMLFAQDIYKNAVSENVTAKSILQDFISNATDLQNRTNIQKSQTFSETFINTVKECIDNENKTMVGIKTGFAKIDKMMGGLSGPDYTVIAAGPGEGKSTFALNISKHVAMNEGDVLFFSYEMKEKQIIWKLMSDDLSTSVMDIRMGTFEKDYLHKNKTHLAKLHIYDKGGLTIDDIIGISKMQAKKVNLKLIVIDYLQLIRLGSYIRKVSNKNDEVTIISNKLKQLAMDLNLPLLVLSQLNRDKTRKRYTKSDLRDSGAVEQDADNAIFIFRPVEHDPTFVYEIGGIPLENVNDETTIINIDKCRLGPTGEFEMVFKGQHSRFEDLGHQRNEHVNIDIYETKIERPLNNEPIPF
jgi:replicative DNA helicase